MRERGHEPDTVAMRTDSPGPDDTGGTTENDAASWSRIRQLFDGALERPPEERGGWLETACAGDRELLSEVRALLDARAYADGRLETGADVLIPAGPDAGPDTVGRYRILGEVGRGGMGVVYRAHDPRHRREVALKFLPVHLHADAHAKARFMDEARAASALDHPGICTIHDIGETLDGQLYIAMACYEGRTLAEIIADGPLDVDRALDLAQQAADAMAHAHQIGILHRDLKPANLFVTVDDEVRILDFGVAKLPRNSALTLPGVRLGTLAYMAPEQTRGEPVDARADVWALGAVLYEMLTGRRPFLGGTDTIVKDAILNAEARPMREVRRGGPHAETLLHGLDAVEPVVRRALAKNALDRYVDAREMTAALRALAGPERNG